MSKSDSLQTTHAYEFSVFYLDVNEGLSANGEPVKLPPKVLQTLTYFVENPGRLITKNEIFDAVWTDSFVEDGALSFNISRLRKALAEYDRDTEFIETVSKRGFRFLAEVRKVIPDNEEFEILIERQQVSELIAEQEVPFLDTDARPKLAAPARSWLKTAGLIAAAVILIVAVATGYIRQARKNAELRSIDSLQSVDVIAWRSAGSSGYSRYSSSHNGKMVAYSSTEDGVSESVFVAQLAGGEKLRITRDQWTNFSPVWSPDDDELAFASMREGRLGIYKCPAFGGVPKLIAEVEPGDLSLRGWSKDGSAIFYEVEGNLFSLNIAGGDISQITDLPKIKAYRRNFAISTDEGQVVFSDETEGRKDLWTMSFRGGKAVRLTNTEDEEIRSTWHPDGNKIFYSVLRKGHYQIDVAYLDGRSEPLQITRGKGKYELIDVSSDGTSLFYQRWLDKSDIWGVATDTGREFTVSSEPEPEFWPDMSPDGRSIAFQSNSAEYVPQALNSSNIIVKNWGDTKTGHAFSGVAPKWLPDSRRIAFLRWQETEEKYNLWLFDTVSGAESQATFNGAAGAQFSKFPFHQSQVSGFDWSPNTDRFVYIDFERKNVWMMSPGADSAVTLTNNTDPRTTFRCVKWSADGNRIAYISQSRTTPGEKDEWSVWVSEGGNARPLVKTPKSLRFLGWAGETLLFEAAEDPIKAASMNIELVKVNLNGEMVPSGAFNNISALSMAMSPDGKRVAYASRVDGNDDIYMASTSKEGAARVTSNSDTTARFGLLRWSPDGKTIFFDKQEEMNIISMFQF